MLQKSVYHLGRQQIGKGWDYRHRSFHRGFAQAIYSRVVEMKRASAAQFTGADAEIFALVSLSKKQWLENLRESLGLRTRKGRAATGRTDWRSWDAGQAEGRKADMSVRNKLGE